MRRTRLRKLAGMAGVIQQLFVAATLGGLILVAPIRSMQREPVSTQRISAPRIDTLMSTGGLGGYGSGSRGPDLNSPHDVNEGKLPTGAK